ncbi:MAG: uracil-DNA glycosylase family protein [Pseudomonadota bacterium]
MQSTYSSADMRQWLRWYDAMGVDVVVGETPVNRLKRAEEAGGGTAPTPNAPTSPGTQGQSPPQGHPSHPAPLPASPSQAASPARPQGGVVPHNETVENARALAASAASLEDLRKALEAFDGCALKTTAHTLVFAAGHASARLMVIGEAPGKDEDRQGLPFVGRSGQLLDRMLIAIGLSRSEEGDNGAYVTNMLPWRPPGNRNPTPEECDLCFPFLERHIDLVDPDLILALGGTAAKYLLKTTTGIMRSRGRWGSLRIGERSIPVMPTFHPAYLLRQSGQKGLAWQDLLAVRARLDDTPAN